jgi:hypothetical protein
MHLVPYNVCSTVLLPVNYTAKHTSKEKPSYFFRACLPTHIVWKKMETEAIEHAKLTLSPIKILV